VIPHRFGYHVPDSVDAAVELVGEAPDESVVLGGGTWVVPGLGDPGSRVRQVIDLRRAGLGGIDDRGDRVRIGAMVTYTQLLRSDLVARLVPLLALVADGVTGGPQIQNQGTIGGAACAARPASDIPCALLAIGAVATLQGPKGPRAVPVAELWRVPFRTTLAADEVLTGFEVPVRPGGVGHRKIKRGTSSWPIVNVSALAALDESGALAELTVAVGAAAATPFLLGTADLAGVPPSGALVEELSHRAREALTDPWSDELAPAGYRAAVLPAAVRRAVEEAIDA
jgi:aerobic carbon-monoxide dehydrogenase medium subunit